MKRTCSIILCGFMGCGKSTAGKSLADMLSLPFRDADSYIGEKSGMNVPEIFSRFGEARFRTLEAQCVRELSAAGGAVIALGGGALGNPDTIKAVRENGVLVYLHADFSVCWHRICTTDRPLVLSNTKEQLEALYNSRLPVYESACHVLVESVKSPLETAGLIIDAVKKAGWDIQPCP